MPPARRLAALRLGALLALFVLGLSVSLGALVPRSDAAREASANLVANGNFEHGLAGWRAYKASLRLVRTGVAGRAGRVSRSSDSWIYRSPRPVPATTAGAVYEVTGWARSSRPGQQLCLHVREVRASWVGKTGKTCVGAKKKWSRFPTLRFRAAHTGMQLGLAVQGRRRGSWSVDEIRLTGPFVCAKRAKPCAPPVTGTTTTTTSPPPPGTSTGATTAPPGTTSGSTTTTTTTTTQPDSRWYSADSPFNQPIAAGASVDPNSAQMVQTLVNGAAGGFPIGAKYWTTPVYYASPSSPKFSVSLTASWAAAKTMSGVPIPPEAKPDPSDDHHLTVLDPATGCEYDMWGAQRNANGSWSTSWGNATYYTGSGVFDGGWATTASGFANAAGKIRPEDFTAGEIRHALVFGFPYTKAGGPVRPATSSDGKSTVAGAIPEGARLQLDASLDLNSLGLNDWQKIVARALQVYGMYLGDSGGTVGLGAVNAQSFAGIPYPWGDADYAYMPPSLLSHMRVLTLGPQYQPTGKLIPTGCATLQ